MEVGSRYNSHCNWATNFSLWKNIQQYDIPTSLLLSLRRTRMAQRQNTTFYGLRKIWQVSKGFGNIVCISENLKKKLESSVTRTNVHGPNKLFMDQRIPFHKFQIRTMVLYDIFHRQEDGSKHIWLHVFLTDN